MFFLQRRLEVISAGDKSVAYVHFHHNKGTQGILLEEGMMLHRTRNLPQGQWEKQGRTPLNRDRPHDLLNHFFEFPDAEKTSLAIDVVL